MSRVWVDLSDLASRDSVYTASYRVAGEEIWATTAIAELSSFSVTQKDENMRALSIRRAHVEPGPAANYTFRGRAWLVRSHRQIECRKEDTGFYIQIAGIGVFMADIEIGSIQFWPAQQKPNPSEVVEALLGPPLILMLAARGVHCLHASAVIYNGRVLAFVGASGRGKSTLARSLSARPGTPFRLAADDTLPFRIRAARVDALPHYPQLKYPPQRQPAQGAPESLPLAAVYVLHDGEETEHASVASLAPSAAAIEIVRNTVASKLFDQTLMRDHLLAATNMAGHTPIRLLNYPHTNASLDKAYKALLRDVDGLA